MRKVQFFTNLQAEIKKSIIGFYKENFPNTWQFFTQSKIDFKIKFIIDGHLFSLAFYNKSEKLVIQFIRNEIENFFIFDFYSVNEKYDSFELILDSKLGFYYNDNLITENLNDTFI